MGKLSVKNLKFKLNYNLCSCFLKFKLKSSLTRESFLEASRFIVVRGEDMNFMTLRRKLNRRIDDQSLCSTCILPEKKTPILGAIQRTSVNSLFISQMVDSVNLVICPRKQDRSEEKDQRFEKKEVKQNPIA